MTRVRVLDRDISTALRSLDAADRHGHTPTDRARADLQTILASDPLQVPPSALASRPAARADRPRRAQSTTRRVMLAGGVVAAVTALMVALPSLTGGDQAFASWTPDPRGLSAQESADAVASCRQMQEDGAGAEYAADLKAAEPVIAERRGVWTTVVLAGTNGFSAMCVSDDSAHLFAKDAIGSVGRVTDHAAPAPRDVTATDLGVGTMKAGDLSLAAGVAGSDVAGAVYHSRTQGDVTATVSGGHFAFWLPGDELEDASTTGVEVEVTYRDGGTGTTLLTL